MADGPLAQMWNDWFGQRQQVGDARVAIDPARQAIRNRLAQDRQQAEDNFQPNDPAAPAVAAGPLAQVAQAAQDAAPPASPVSALFGAATGGLPDTMTRNPLALAAPASSGPLINNAGVTSNFNGPVGLSPISGMTSTPDDRGLAALGYASTPEGNLRRIGSYGQYEQQMTLMDNLLAAARRAAPPVAIGPTMADTEASRRSHDAFIGQQTNSLMQHFAPTIMPQELARRHAEGYAGPNGWIPGSIATNAQQSAAQFSPAGIQAQAAQRIREILATRTDLSPEEINNTLRQLGAVPNTTPNYLGSQPGTTRGPGGAPGAGGASRGDGTQAVVPETPLPDQPLTPIQQRIREALAAAMNAFPDTRQGTNARTPHSRTAPNYVPTGTGANQDQFFRAATDYLSNFTPDELRANYGAIANEINGRLGASAMSDFWSSQEPTGPLADWRMNRDPEIARRIAQLRRITAMRSGRTPMSATIMGVPNLNTHYEAPLFDPPGSLYRRGAFPLTLE